jgi:hypothetical protein
MNGKVKSIALTLGLLILMVVPAGAQNTTYGPAGGNAPPDDSIRRIAGSSSLVTENRNPAPENDPQLLVPHLVVIESQFEFDRVLEGEEVEHDFLIENRGDAPLAIHQVRTG